MNEAKSFEEFEQELEHATAVDVCVRIAGAIVMDMDLTAAEKVIALAKCLEDMVARLSEKSYSAGGRPPLEGRREELSPSQRSAAEQAIRRGKNTPAPPPADVHVTALKEILTRIGG